MRSLEKNVQSEGRGPGQGTNIYKRMQKKKQNKTESSGAAGETGGHRKVWSQRSEEVKRGWEVGGDKCSRAILYQKY